MSTAIFAAPLYVPKFREVDANGNPLAGGKVYTYVAGTTTPVASYPTFDDALAGTNANANPVVLDANGEASIFVQVGAYKIALYDSTDVLRYTLDDIYAGGSGTPVEVPGASTDTGIEWLLETATPVYVSGTEFTVTGNLATRYHAGRRLKTSNAPGTVYATVVSSSYSAPNTTVTVVCDSSALQAGLNTVWYGINSNNAHPSHRDVLTAVAAIKNGDMTGFGSATKVTAWTGELDNVGALSGAAEFTTPTFTAKYPGKYAVDVSIEFADSGTDVAVTGYIYVNGVAVRQSVNRSDDTANEIKSMHLHWLGTLAAGGTVEVYVLGSANTTVKGTSGTSLEVARVA